MKNTGVKNPGLLRALRVSGIVLFNAVVCLSLMEIFWIVLLKSPALWYHVPHPVLAHLQEIYLKERSTVQDDPRMCRYDPELGYTLNPGKFVFSNAEFGNEFYVNSAGLRDDEESLRAPEIIVLGDSHAMGWGVEQDETFAQIIERRTGYKVLNAAVSSYGTVREKMLLDRLDTSNLKVLIVQYSENDTRENYQFLMNNNLHAGISREEWDKAVEEHRRSRRYFPGKYTFQKVSNFWRPWFARSPEAERPHWETASVPKCLWYALNALMNAGTKNLDGVHVVFAEVNENGSNSEGLVVVLMKMLQSLELPAYLEGMQAINTRALFQWEDYYPLDGHINKRGHETLAGAVVMALIAENKIQPRTPAP